MSYEATIPDRLKTLEIKVDGNGGAGLLKRMDNAELDLKHQDERIDHLELRKVDIVKCERYHTIQSASWKDYEKRLEDKIIETINSHEKKWLRNVGPILTGFAALVLAMKELL